MYFDNAPIIFDFGAYWEFTVEVVGCSIHRDKPVEGYSLIQSVGDAPEQYCSWY